MTPAYWLAPKFSHLIGFRKLLESFGMGSSAAEHHEQLAMIRLILKRLTFAVPMLFIVSFFSFALVSLSPTDPARIVAGPFADETVIAQTRTELGLDRPLVVRYLDWVGDALTGDLGRSITVARDVPVTQLLNPAIPTTAWTVGLSLLLAGTVGTALGVISAVKGGSSGRAVSVFSLAGLAIPGFWLVLVLNIYLAVKWKVFPVIGYTKISDSPWQWARGLILPVFAVSVGPIASFTKQTRDSMLDALGRDFVRVMQANGIPKRSVIYRHALKNAAIPLVTLLGINAVSLIGAAVVIENIKAFNGLGTVAVNGALSSDLPLVQGAVVYFCLFVIAIGVIVDISYSFLDPRVRVR
jgi:peptide/nickel transport system permease protein